MRSVMAFMRDLADHNDTAWMQAHRDRYDQEVRRPLLAFATEAATGLARLGIAVTPRDVLAPQHRDRRFRSDAPPYWTHALLRFPVPGTPPARHRPGFVLQLGDVTFFSAGLAFPRRGAADAIRARIVARPGDWTKATRGLSLADERLRRLPPQLPGSHRHAADLRLRSFTSTVPLAPEDVADPGFRDAFLAACREHLGLVRFIQKALA